VRNWDRCARAEGLKHPDDGLLSSVEGSSGRMLMLSAAENELMCRVGTDAPQGKALRRFWLPTLMSSELSDAGQRCLAGAGHSRDLTDG
jgi:hypothetical protein